MAPSPAPTISQANGNSLSNVVSSLVRAQYGLATRETGNAAEDTDLDRHVAELLLQEAKEREERSKKENVGYWRLSDDEGEQNYQSRTNKRFLKNVLKGIEDHNAPLIRKEPAKPALDLNAIRRKEREERERRTGIKDSERSHRRGDRESSASTSNREQEASSSASSFRKDGRDISVKGPGFAARSFAIGLSGALGSRRENGKKDADVKTAIEDARQRANGESSESRKGKGRAVDSVEEEHYESERRRDDRRSAARSEDGESRHAERSSRKDAKSGSRSDRRRRSRSRTPDSDEERSSRRRRHREDSYEDNRDRRRRDSRRHRDDSDDEDASRRRRSRDRKISDRDTKDTVHPPAPRHKRRRSTSAASQSEGESSASVASSDTFVDVSELPGTAAGTSKMDKYFSQTYNPALDVSFTDLTDANTGLIAEGNFSEWDKMLAVLKKRKEDKVFGVSRAREEEREEQLRKLEKKKRHEEREAKRALKKEKKRKKKRRRGSEDEDSETSGESVGPKEKEKSPVGKTVVIDGFEYGKKGSTRAWDLGKDAML